MFNDLGILTGQALLDPRHIQSRRNQQAADLIMQLIGDGSSVTLRAILQVAAQTRKALQLMLQMLIVHSACFLSN